MRATRAQIEAGQLRQLQELLRAILPRNRFYARKLAAAGFHARRPAGLRGLLARIPFTTKDELVADQRSRPPYGTRHTLPLEAYTRFHQTSGTTGAPLRCLDTAADWAALVEARSAIYRAAGIGGHRGDRVFFPFSFGPFMGFWLAFEAAQQAGCLCLSGGGLSSAARLRLLLDNAATVLSCTPTYALRLAEVAREENIPLHLAKVHTVFVAGEPGGGIPSVRDRISAAWNGARVLDNHGMSEVGPLTFESPRRPGVLQLLEEFYVAEILDPATHEEVSPGETGELVLTTLRRPGSPLLRYRTGDLVRKGFVQGRLAFPGGILSRLDDMVVVRGVNLYPSAVESVMRSFPEVAEYRVTVTRARALAEVRLEVEPAAGCRQPRGLAGRLANALETTFALRIPVDAVPRGTLPQFELKAKRWVVTAPGQASNPITS
jgi:phenylacetate-CoA ligase